MLKKEYEIVQLGDIENKEEIHLQEDQPTQFLSMFACARYFQIIIEDCLIFDRFNKVREHGLTKIGSGNTCLN